MPTGIEATTPPRSVSTTTTRLTALFCRVLFAEHAHVGTGSVGGEGDVLRRAVVDRDGAAHRVGGGVDDGQHPGGAVGDVELLAGLGPGRRGRREPRSRPDRHLGQHGRFVDALRHRRTGRRCTARGSAGRRTRGAVVIWARCGHHDHRRCLRGGLGVAQREQRRSEQDGRGDDHGNDEHDRHHARTTRAGAARPRLTGRRRGRGQPRRTCGKRSGGRVSGRRDQPGIVSRGEPGRPRRTRSGALRGRRSSRSVEPVRRPRPGARRRAPRSRAEPVPGRVRSPPRPPAGATARERPPRTRRRRRPRRPAGLRAAGPDRRRRRSRLPTARSPDRRRADRRQRGWRPRPVGAAPTLGVSVRSPSSTSRSPSRATAVTSNEDSVTSHTSTASPSPSRASVQ